METYQTYLPVFKGFYNNANFEPDFSCYENDIKQERIDKKMNPLDKIELEIDNTQFELDISKKLCKYIESEFNKECESKIKITFEKVVSPKYYNYSNDSIDVKIECNLVELIVICEENFDEFNEYVISNYTSCDGFWSSHSNDVLNWLNIDYIKENVGHRVGTILNFICQLHEISESNICELEIYEREYFTNYDYYLNLQVWEREVICFSDKDNFDKGLAWFIYYSELGNNFEITEENFEIRFSDNEKNILNQLAYSPMIDFKYHIMVE